jgi:hypothetical protein
MRQTLAALLVALGLLVTATSPEAEAKGVFSRIIITGPDLDAPIMVEQPLALALLSLGTLEDMRDEGAVETPPDAAEIGYDLERQWDTPGGDYSASDRVRYHPNADGGRGYIYIVKMMTGESIYDQRWFPVTPEGEAALRAVLAGETVECPVTPARDDVEALPAGQPVIGGDSIWFAALDVTAPDPTAPKAPNAAGSIFVHESVQGSFVMGSRWLEGQGFAEFIRPDWSERITGGKWVDHLIADEIAPDATGYACYDWEAYFPHPGCYMLYAYADYQGIQVYIEVKAD